MFSLPYTSMLIITAYITILNIYHNEAIFILWAIIITNKLLNFMLYKTPTYKYILYGIHY